MDRTGEQLRYSNRIINSVALKNDTRIGFCEMYQNNNGCLCMSVNRKNSEFDSFAECNGMCTKQNINIFIENFDAKRHKGEYDPKGKSVNESKYSFYKAVEQNSSNGKAFVTDLAWLEANDKRDYAKQNSNPNYYPYNQQYLPRSLPYVRTQIENISVSTAHGNPQVVENPSHRDNSTYMFQGVMEKDKTILKGLHDENASCIASGNMTSPSCSNLYVEPPYFTVDKFVNEDKPLIRSTSRSAQFYNENVFHYQRVPNNFEENLLTDSLIQNRSVHDQEIIGIKLVENPDIPHMHFETSIKPVSLDIIKPTRYLPIKKEKCNYENDFVLDSNFSTEISTHDNTSHGNDFNGVHESFSSNRSPVSQCNSTDIQNLENKISHELVGAYNKVKNSESLQFSHPHGNFKSEIYTKIPSSNVIIPSSKNLARDVRKPNYRELINHVHALRNATSEDDLNMQIIKRTLNYNQKSKKISTCNLRPRQFDSNEFSINNKINTHDPICMKQPPKSNMQDDFFNNLPTNVSPLDLSVKTVKSNADSTANDSCCKVLISGNGYPPKFNFKPDFSENRRISNDTISTVDHDCYKFGLSRPPLEATQTNVVMDTPRHVADCYKQPQNNLNVIGCRLKNEILLHASIPNLQSNFVCNFQNCVPVQKCMNKDVGNGFKVEVTLKRSADFKSDLEEDYDKKKICIESFYHSETDLTKRTKPLYTTAGKLSSNNKQNLQINNQIPEPLYPKDNAKNEIEHITPTSVQELIQTNMEAKQDDSSVIAARIRTKAELKGFAFHEGKPNYFNESLSNKENYHCNDRSNIHSQVEEMVDLIEWKNACNSFVDQLIQGCTDTQNNKQTKCFESKKQDSEVKISVMEKEKLTNSPEKKSAFQTDDVFAKVIDNPPPLAKVEINSTARLNEYLGTNCNGISKQKTDPKSGINHMKSDYIKSKYYVGYKIKPYDTKIEEIEPKNENKHMENIIQSCEKLKKSCLVNTITSTDEEDGKNDINNKNKLFQNKSKAIDLKKISVVRLKREKYESKLYTQCNQNSAKTKLVSNCSNNIAKRRTIKNKPSSTCEEDTTNNCIVKSKDSIGSKSNTITTRLRHHMSQLNNNPESKSRINKIQKSKKNINKFQRHKNEKDNESSHDLDKLYLEVYRYKRALKIPPNLITIKNSCEQGISSSLPDLDLDIQSSSVQSETSNNNEFKVDEGPKSIIDVLHSRVIKTKNEFKNNLRHTKTENQRSLQTKFVQCNNQSANFKQSTSSENNCSNRKYRNVFETQILASRTRTEYKMQLNKEVIREIFGGSERPASAPPEINNIKNDFQLVFEQHYKKYLNSNNSTFMRELGEQKKYVPYIQPNLQGEKSEQKGSTNNNDQSRITIKYKQKKCGRSYRRKFSSGFDYLRKKKKSKTRTLFKYTQLKSRVETYMSESAQYIKNETDISREIQKWVLNKSVGQSTLHKAARLGYIDVIVYCLERMGLNPDHKDNAGYTPLHDACVKGSLDIARVLLQYGANHSEGAHSGIRPLHEASENGHIEVVRMLLSYGADPLLETYSGQTPLMLASETKMSDFILKHLLDIQMNEAGRQAWRFPGPWKILDNSESGYDAFSDIRNQANNRLCYKKGQYYADAQYLKDSKKCFVSNLITESNSSKKNNSNQKNDVCELEILVDTMDAEGELFEFEEANMPLPPLYMLKDEGMEKWVLLNDLCSLLKVKSKDTLLHKIFPSISPTIVSRVFIRELKMCDFLEKATCLQLLCAGEKINICHSKVVLVQYNENVRELLGVNTILMKF